jgi:large subunit ribosomal protein L17
MLSNMANSLIEHKRINTTLAKAKALRVFVEPLLTKSKNDTVNSRRQVFSYLQNKYTVTELFREVAPKIADRPGGYTRIIKTGFRKGDNAEMCMIELVDFNELMLAEPKKEKRNTRRSRSRKKADDTTVETPQDETVVTEDTPTEEAETNDSSDDAAEGSADQDASDEEKK